MTDVTDRPLIATAFRSLTLGPALLALLLASGCSSSDSISTEGGIEGAPEWVNQGSLAMAQADRRYIQGVGTAPELGDRLMQKSSADNRARTEVARMLATYMEIVVEEFLNTGGGDRAALTGQVNDSLSRILRGARIVGNWRNPADGTIYTLARIELDTVLSTLREQALFDGDLRRFMLEYGEDIFDRVHQRMR